MSVNGRVRAAAALGVAAITLAVVAPASASPSAPAKASTDQIPVTMTVSPDSSDVYGVGQLVTARFSSPIKRKAEVEKAITISSKKDVGEGSWGWIDDRTAVYRPRTFWPANARITFDFALRGLELGQNAEATLVGAPGTTRSYTLQTGRSFVMEIRDSKHRLYARKDGKVVKSFPVSLGKPGWETRSGIKILTGEKYVKLRMTGYDPGAKEHWDVVAPWSIRLTPTGEFIHGAPWAAYRMGIANGSHGCTNMFPRDAKWIYRHVRAGDPVITKGTGRPMTTNNGVPGAYWNYTWREWLNKSAVTGAPQKWQAAQVPPVTTEAGP